MKDAYAKETSAVFAELEATAEGLSDADAKGRLAEYGMNELPREQEPSRLLLFLGQFANPLTYILAAAAAISLFTDHVFDAVAIVIELIINAAFGFLQERKAERALSRLRELAPPEAIVRRDGRMARIQASALVPGDVVRVTEGDRVPADLRILSSRGLKADESALTGESLPVEKSAAISPEGTAVGDRLGMLFMGTLAVAGEATCLVVETGPRTAFGGIAGSLASIKREPTPLERRVSRLSGRLVAAALVLSTAIFVIGLFRGLPLVDMFLFSVASAVSAIPEGLPVVLAIVLAIGVQRMAARNAVTRHLPAVETLGGVDVICTDKTGTLTENKMTVRNLMTIDRWIEVTGEGWEPRGEFLEGGERLNLTEHHIVVSHLLRVASLCNRAAVEQRDGHWAAVGDPTEAALAVLGAKAGYVRADLLQKEKTLDDLPFNSERKYRAILHDYIAPNGRPRREIMVVGALEALIGRTSMALSHEGPRLMDDAVRARFVDAQKKMGGDALRVLAVAVREVDADVDRISQDDVRDLSLLGLVGMIDPPRKGVAEAVRKCREAGIRIIMTTGDHPETALAIAREIGLAGMSEHVVTDAQVVAMDDKALSERLVTAAVFARVSPETKLRIVTLLKQAGHVVAMTGDGINDAPALKKADIGIAMGLSGTDVTREVAEMVLADDDFVSIVGAVEEGRIVFRNVKQTTAYLVMTNFGEIATILASMIAGLPLPLLPAQVLWLNVVTDGFSDVSLATERRHGDELTSPRKIGSKKILSKNLALMTAITAAMMAGGTIAMFKWGLAAGGLTYARSLALLSMSFFQLWNVFSMRSASESIFKLGFFSNRWVFAGNVASVLLIVLIMYVPFLQAVFRLQPLGLAEWIWAGAVSASVLVVIELYKVFIRKGTIPPSWL